MSTPSTATATLPPHHQFFSHRQTFQPPVSNYHYNTQRANGAGRLANPQYPGYASSASSDPRRTATNGSRQSQQTPSQSAATTTLDPPKMAGARSHERKTNWAEFYKHGLPKEVIVIDDDDSPPPPRPAQQRPSNGTRTVATNGSTRHADKRRKTAASAAYDPVYQQPPSYSTTQTPYNDISPSNYTMSTDRTASAHNTTAATSLGSQISNSAYIQPVEDGTVGQKRKRTRKAVADEAQEAKRRELELAANPFDDYVPPPNPPIKERDVYVPVISDVSSLPCILIVG